MNRYGDVADCLLCSVSPLFLVVVQQSFKLSLGGAYPPKLVELLSIKEQMELFNLGVGSNSTNKPDLSLVTALRERLA